MRAVYVVHAAANAPPETVIDRWPTMARTLDALHRHGVDVVAVCATHAPSTEVVRDGVRYVFVRDRTRLRHAAARAVRRERPDIVHVNGFIFPLPTLALRAVLADRRVAIVVQHHGEAPVTERARAAVAQRVAARAIDGALFTGAAFGQADDFRRAGALATDTPVLDVLESSADLVPIDRDEARTITNTRTAGDPAILWVGRLNDGKDPLTAIEGFARFAATATTATLTMLYADAPLEADVRAAVAALDAHVARRIHLAGRVAHDEMAAWYSTADIFCSTSRHEGSGYALIEALACGCTPVVSAIAPHRAITGSLGGQFAVGDAAALAERLTSVSCVLRGSDGGAERTAVRDDFGQRLGWDAVAAQLVAAYRAASQHATTRPPGWPARLMRRGTRPTSSPS